MSSDRKRYHEALSRPPKTDTSQMYVPPPDYGPPTPTTPNHQIPSGILPYIPRPDYPERHNPAPRPQSQPRHIEPDYINGDYPFETYGHNEKTVRTAVNDRTSFGGERRPRSTNSNLHHNPALERHLKNHKKFDTFRSGNTCTHCPICKAMNAANDAIGHSEVDEDVDERRSHHRQTRVRFAPKNDSNVRSEFQLQYLDELRQRSALAATVTQDRVARTKQELTVITGEVLQVLDDGRSWWECVNASGKSGFVPNSILNSVSMM